MKLPKNSELSRKFGRSLKGRCKTKNMKRILIERFRGKHPPLLKTAVEAEMVETARMLVNSEKEALTDHNLNNQNTLVRFVEMAIKPKTAQAQTTEPIPSTQEERAEEKARAEVVEKENHRKAREKVAVNQLHLLVFPEPTGKTLHVPTFKLVGTKASAKSPTAHTFTSK